MKILDWQIYALGSAFFAGAVAILAKIGIADVPSNLATLIRTIVITLFLVVLVSVRSEWINPSTINKKAFIFLILSGIATGLSWICYFRALQLGPASLVTSIDKFSLVFTVLLAVLLLGERLNLLQWSGVALMTVGALLIFWKK